MNIRDTDKVPATLRIETSTARNEPAKKTNLPIDQPENQDNTEESQDEFVRSNVEVSGSALYDISDVRGARTRSFDNRFQVNKSILSSEKFTEKLVDVILPAGVKSLKIFKSDE